MWGDEDGDDASSDSDNDDSDRLYDFVVAKTNDQEENVVARPGFTVHIFSEESLIFLILTLALLSEDEHTTPCQSTSTAGNAYRSQRPVSEVASWRNKARYHDRQIQACEDVGREDFAT